MAGHQRVSALLDSEPAYRWVLMRMLEYCSEPKIYLDVQNYTRELLKDKVGVHTPDVLLKWLEETGGLERVQIDGEGMWATTSSGTQAVLHISQGKPLENLINNQPEHRDVYLKILNFCVNPRKREEIEEVLAGEPVLQRSRLHPAFFINELEKQGGLEWSEKRWRTTSDGKGVIA